MLATIFSIVPLTLNDWIVVLAFSFPVIIIDEVLKFFGRQYQAKELAKLLHHEAPGRRADAGFLVVELLGRSLDELWQTMSESKRAPARLSATTLLCVGRGVLRLLRELHDAGFVHNDLKPANIFVRLLDGKVKLGDLGLSRGIAVDDETGDAIHPTEEHLTEYVVTRWYRAPEVLLARSKYGPPVDVWSVGCILYEMWGGKTLFPGQPYLALPQPDSARFPRLCAPHLDIRSQCKECLNFDGIADYELLGSGRTPYQWGFERTPIGLMQPPIQYYKVTNLGSVPLSFHMDLSEVEQLNANNYNFEVVSVLDNNDLDSIEPGESILLRWVFNPLEPKMYHWKVPFQIHGYDGYEYEVEVHFSAEGFQEDPHVTPVTTVLPLPMYQVMPLPNQSVFLSEERLCLGDIPIGASISRIIFLTNFHQDDVMDYAFVLTSSLAKDVVEVFPSEGERQDAAALADEARLKAREVSQAEAQLAQRGPAAAVQTLASAPVARPLATGGDATGSLRARACEIGRAHV